MNSSYIHVGVAKFRWLWSVVVCLQIVNTVLCISRIDSIIAKLDLITVIFIIFASAEVSSVECRGNNLKWLHEYSD